MPRQPRDASLTPVAFPLLAGEVSFCSTSWFAAYRLPVTTTFTRKRLCASTSKVCYWNYRLPEGLGGALISRNWWNQFSR